VTAMMRVCVLLLVAMVAFSLLAAGDAAAKSKTSVSSHRSHRAANAEKCKALLAEALKLGAEPTGICYETFRDNQDDLKDPSCLSYLVMASPPGAANAAFAVIKDDFKVDILKDVKEMKFQNFKPEAVKHLFPADASTSTCHKAMASLVAMVPTDDKAALILAKHLALTHCARGAGISQLIKDCLGDSKATGSSICGGKDQPSGTWKCSERASFA